MGSRAVPPRLRRKDVHVWRCGADVREILAGYLDDVFASGSLGLERGMHGKPEPPPGSRVRFNIARSGSFTLLAVTRGRDVGVDVERIEPARAHGPIADRLFSESEAAELRSLPDDDRTRRFFELWTRKEAYAKALGVGMAMPLRLLHAPPDWFVQDVPVVDGFAGAVCVHGRGLRVRLLP